MQPRGHAFSPRRNSAQRIMTRPQSAVIAGEHHGERARAEHRHQREGRHQRAEHVADRRDAIDIADQPPAEAHRREQQAHRERREHAHQRERQQQQRGRRQDDAGHAVADAAQHPAEQRIDPQRNAEQIKPGDDQQRAAQPWAHGAVDQRAADQVAEHQRDQHGRDQRRPGVDAAAEVRIEVAARQHLEAHQREAEHDGDDEQQQTAQQGGRHQRGASVWSFHFSLFCSMARMVSTGAKSSVRILPVGRLSTRRPATMVRRS